jgi:hypothetical protein
MWNDQQVRVDLLGHRRIAETLVSIMQQEALRLLTLGIHRSWGAGKSSILSLIDAQIRYEPKPLCVRTLCIAHFVFLKEIIQPLHC